MWDGLEGLQGQLKEGRKRGRGRSSDTHTHTQRATVALGTWSCQDLALMKSKGERETARCLTSGKARLAVVPTRRKWVESRLAGLSKRQAMKGTDQGNGKRRERDSRVTPKVSLKEFGNQWGIWDWVKMFSPFCPRASGHVTASWRWLNVNQNQNLGCQQERWLCEKFFGGGVADVGVSVFQRLHQAGKVFCHVPPLSSQPQSYAQWSLLPTLIRDVYTLSELHILLRAWWKLWIFLSLLLLSMATIINTHFCIHL